MTPAAVVYPQQPGLVCWHASEPLLCVIESESLALWHATDGLVRIPMTWGAPNTVAFFGDNILLADEDGSLMCISTQGVQIWRRDLESCTGRIDTLVVSSYAACLGDSLTILDAQGDVLWRHYPDHVYPKRQAYPDEAIWYQDSLLVRWDTHWTYLNLRGQVVCKFDHSIARQACVVDGLVKVKTCHVQDPFARSHTWSADLTHVAIEGREHVVWLQDHKPLRTIEGHPRTITAMAWSEGHVLYTGCRDGALRRLSPHDTFELVSDEAGVVSHIAFSADNAWLCCSTRDRVTILPMG
jgi:hypothetical protein